MEDKRGEQRYHRPQTPKFRKYKESLSDHNISTIGLRNASKRMKRNKVVGPDAKPMELLTCLDNDNFEIIEGISNTWWRDETIPEDVRKASIHIIRIIELGEGSGTRYSWCYPAAKRH